MFQVCVDVRLKCMFENREISFLALMENSKTNKLKHQNGGLVGDLHSE